MFLQLNGGITYDMKCKTRKKNYTEKMFYVQAKVSIMHRVGVLRQQLKEKQR